MKVVEIFTSIEGEGIRAGFPCVFIRLFGCNLHCSYCDSQYACTGEEYVVMSIPEIMQSVKFYSNGIKRVTVTGGEPLIHDGIDKLLQTLIDEGYEVNVETNGTKFPKRFPIDPVEDIHLDPRRMVEVHYVKPESFKKGRLFYTMDWKCKSSGMENEMLIDIVNDLENDDVLKFVVGSKEDMDGALSVIERMTSKPHIFFSPVFDKIEPKDIVEYITTKGLNDCRVQLQLHKFIWDKDKRGV